MARDFPPNDLAELAAILARSYLYNPTASGAGPVRSGHRNRLANGPGYRAWAARFVPGVPGRVPGRAA